MKFTKPPLDVHRQLAKLQERGLQVSDPAQAKHYLSFIGYYRLSAYALPLQTDTDPTKPFKPGVCFQDIMNLYLFDRDLRLLVMDAIERIEVAIRSVIITEMCVKHGSHWILEAKHFSGKYKHHELLSRLDKELDIPPTSNRPKRTHRERFINHYFNKYTDPTMPPTWMLGELLPLGTWSHLFSNLRQAPERKKIAQHFSVDEYILKNWLHAMTHLRNICAHHARLWNRQFSIKPMIAKKHDQFLKANDRCFAMFVVLYDLLKCASPKSFWCQKLADLLKLSPFIHLQAMGFPENWIENRFWQEK